MEEIFEFYQKYIELQNVLRKGWLMRKVKVERKENDSDHTLQTILLAHLIIKKYQLQDLNLLRIMEMLLIHEIGEIVIGDIAMVEADYEERKKSEEKAVQNTLRCLGGELSKYYFELWKEFEYGMSREAKFAYFIDKMDAVVKAKIYDGLNNSQDLFNEFSTHAISTLESKDNEFLPLLRELQH